MQHVPSSAPLCPWLPLPALLPPGDVATTALAPGKGEVVLKTEGQSHQQWVPGYPRSPVSCTSPLSLLLSAVTLLPESGTAPACQGALPQCLPCLGFCLPRSSYSWLSDPNGCRGGREELSSCSCPDRPWGLLLMAMPCAQDRSCFEERSCQSGLGLLSACGAGGWEGCSFSQLHSCPPAWDLRARAPSSRWRSPPLTGPAAEWAAPLGHDQGLVLAQRVGRACQAGSGPGIVSRERGPRWHPHTRTAASPGAPSFFMRRSLLCDRRLLMLNALIRRDKTTLKIPRCRPPAGARGLPGGRRPGQGGRREVPKLLVL